MTACAMLMFILLGAAPATTPSAPSTQQSVAIGVRAADPTIARVVFDPTHEPKESHLRPNEAARTDYTFDCRPRITCAIVSSRAVDTDTEVTFRVASAQIDVALDDTIRLPINADLALREHEEGHREINERLYREFTKDAPAELRAQLARTWTMRGPGDSNEVLGSAQEQLDRGISEWISARFIDEANAVNVAFDQITNHGRRKVVVSDAIADAIAREHTNPTTRPFDFPATTQSSK